MTEIPPSKIQINQDHKNDFCLKYPQEERQTILKRIQRITGDTRTHGIEIQKQQISIPDKKEKLELNVWDFGGQHEYYNNHHYFLSARSIFLVVWSQGGRRPEESSHFFQSFLVLLFLLFLFCFFFLSFFLFLFFSLLVFFFFFFFFLV